ncbi:hypothetical protein D3C76_1751300 [compost metagenome]
MAQDLFQYGVGIFIGCGGKEHHPIAQFFERARHRLQHVRVKRISQAGYDDADQT